jgi:sigma-B regulation protein RsbU (phosphoserine phosphatase)
MRVRFLHSLPVRLAGLILLLSGLTLLILTEMNRRAVERLLIEQAELQAASATTAMVDGLDGVIASVERLANFVTRDLEGRVPAFDAAEKMARDVVVDNPNVYGFGIAFESKVLPTANERRGVYVHRSDVPSGFVTRDLAAADQTYWTRDWYREVLERGGPVWSEPFFDRGGTDRNAIRIALPIVRLVNDEPESIGAVTAVIDLDWLRRLANLNEFSDTSFTIIFSRSGRLIVHPKPNYVIAETVETLAEKTNTPELLLIRQGIVARRQGAMSYTESFPTRRVHVNYKPAKTAGWGVVVGFDEAEFLKTQRTFRGITAAFLGALLLILPGIVILVTWSGLRPLGQLSVAAGEIAAQNLDCEIPPPKRDDEVGRLTRAFRTMRDALKVQRRERRWADQALQHQLRYNQLIIDTIDELVFVLTKVMNISRVNPAVLRTSGYTEAEVIKAPMTRLVRLAAGADGQATEKLAPLSAAIKEERGVQNLPAFLVRKDGAEVPVLLSLVPMRDGNQIIGSVITLRVAKSQS